VKSGYAAARVVGMLCASQLLSWCFSCPAFSQASDITLTFATRPPQVLSPEHATTLTGHAFIIIGVNTSSGVKDEIFGFYPVSSDGKGMIKGPGMLKSDLNKESVTIPISVDQRVAVYDVIKQWDSKSTIGADGKQFVPSSDADYRLFDPNCNDFLAAVASRLGYPTPDRLALQTPTEFLAAFKPLAEQENKVREANRKASEMKERADAAEAKARAAEEKAKEAEIARQKAEQDRQKAEQERQEAEAQTIPAGWVACVCPQLHSSYGKWVNGVLYHPANKWQCPQK
jgi:hypothetical protein